MADATIETLVGKYIAARDKKAAIMDEAKSRCAKIDDVLEKIEGILLAAFDEAGLESVKTSQGTAYKTQRNSYTVSDWETTLQFILDNNLLHMLERRVAKGAVDAYRADSGEIPPGLNARTDITINIRRS